MQPFFDRMDQNGDGQIDAEEIAAMRSRMGGGPGGAHPAAADRRPPRSEVLEWQSNFTPSLASIWSLPSLLHLPSEPP